jgi:imidazolonepropionase-like amidohydrolase
MTAAKGYLIKGKVIDGTGAAPIDDGAVVVEGERIAWVGAVAEMPADHANAGHEVVELTGRCVVPGIVDGHVHISFGEARSEEELALYTPVEYRAIKAIWNARKVLRAGVTSASDAATTFNVGPAVRDAIEAGMFEGPRFACAGRQLTTHQGLEDSFPSWMEFPPGQAGVLVRSQDEILEAIRLQIKDTVDVIKVSGSSDSAISNDPIEGSAFREEEFRLIADETHRLHRHCTVHARSRESVTLSAKAGFDWIMHASYIDDEAIEHCLKNKISICPTLNLLVNIIASSEGEVGASIVDVFKAEVDAAAEGLSKAYRAGVPLIAGSESGWSLVPYGQWHAKEMETFVTLLGLSPLEALRAGTLDASHALPKWRGQIGSLEAGKFADLIVLEGDVSEDITHLQRPSRFDMVMKAGRVIDTETPVDEPKRYAYERHRMFLPGRFVFDEETGKGSTVA